MEKISLKLSEFYQLEAEIGGMVNQSTSEKVLKGLVNEKVKLITKYWLQDLLKRVSSEKESIEKLKNELIEKYGEKKEDGISIPVYINVVVDEDTKEVASQEINPNFIAFQNEFNALLNEVRELEYRPFSLQEFEDVTTEDSYTVFFKLIKVPD